MAAKKTNRLDILLYVPNLIGYLRVILVAIGALALYFFDGRRTFLFLYIASAIFDGFDGWAARRLGQVSVFGAWFDIVIDNFSRQLLWVQISPCAWIIGAWEWLVFSCTHNLGAKWKMARASEMPKWVELTMKNGLKTPLGILTIAGLHALPVVLYALSNDILPIQNSVIVSASVFLLTIGRIWCFSVETYFVVKHVGDLLDENVDAAQ